MEIKEIRLNNLKTLIEELGGLQAVATRARTSYDNLWQIVSGTKLPSGKPRGIGNDLARKLEEGCGKPIGWMDRSKSLSSMAARMIEIYESLDPSEQRRVLKIFEAATGYAVPDIDIEQKMPITKPVKPQN